MRIAVLGGGISGLTAAYELGKKHDVTLFEANDRTGGNIHTETCDGYRIEWGPNGFLDNEPATLELVRELGIEDRLIRARPEAARRFIYRAGKLRELPSSPAKFLFGDCLPLCARVRVLAEPWSRKAPQKDESVREFAVRHLGVGAADVLIDAFVTGVFAGDPARLSLRSAFPKLHKLESEYGSLIKGAKGRGFGPKGVLTSFDHGLQVLIDELTKRVDVRLSSPADPSDRGDFDHVVNTLPAVGTRIPGAPVAVVALMFDDPPAVPDVFGFLVPKNQGLRILGGLYDSSIYANRAPENRRLFRTLIGGRRDPEVLSMSDEELLEVSLNDLGKAWGLVPNPSGHRVIRWPNGIPQYEVGHSKVVADFERETPEWMTRTGSSFHGVAMNACIAEARRLSL
jgi:oxygen-dependent protoporphyrinogen oxidase